MVNANVKMDLFASGPKSKVMTIVLVESPLLVVKEEEFMISDLINNCKINIIL